LPDISDREVKRLFLDAVNQVARKARYFSDTESTGDPPPDITYFMRAAAIPGT
jgi:hypothetical protein